MSPVSEAAVAAHVMFLGLIEGGFTEDQALKLVAYYIHANKAPDADS